MFRARFGDAFSKSIPHLGPQDIERGVAEPQSTEQVEKLLCALLGLVLNRKKEVEYVCSLPTYIFRMHSHVLQKPNPSKSANN